jgi:hypothetical protein
MPRPSPALAVACIALFASLAGNAIAVTHSLVTSKDIKDGTIQLVDLSPSARAALRGQRGPIGPQGPEGRQGLQGPQGPAGQPADPTQLAALQTRVAKICATGKVVNYAYLTSLYNAYYLNLSYAYC